MNRSNTSKECGRTSRSSLPSRKSPRAEFHNYSGGDYFVTICTQDKKHFFGKIDNKEMKLSTLGIYCSQQFDNISTHYPYSDILQYVVMPNHVHAIIRINLKEMQEKSIPNFRSALSVIIGGLKRSVTMFAHRNNISFEWQKRYHDHIIRGNDDGLRISEYIENNVLRWATDCFYSE